MNFTPKTEEEINTFDLLEKGIYPFEVLKAEDQVSKNGNEMIKLTLGIYTDNGSRTYVYDYLLASVEYKLKHFCDAVGLVGEYQLGSLTADVCANRTGMCGVGIQKDKSGQYPDKNVVRDYHSADAVGGEKTNKSAGEDVPF